MIILLVILLLVAGVAEVYSILYALRDVTYETYTSKISVDPGEEFEVVTVIENHKGLMVPFLRVQEVVPKDIQIQDADLEMYSSKGYADLFTTMYLAPRQRVERRLTATMPARGRYFFQGASLQGGDFLGLSQAEDDYPVYQELVVLPARAEYLRLRDVLGGFLGERSAQRFIMEDPILTLGYREYTGREPQKAISWAQSAHTGRLMVKKYDFTTEVSCTVLLNVEYDKNMDYPYDAIEECFSIARTVCEELEAKRIKYDFFTNATAAGAVGMWSQVNEGLGKSHLDTILEGLGRATYRATEPFVDTLGHACQTGESGRGYVIITPQELPAYQPGIRKLRELRGGSTLVLTPPEKEVSTA